MEAGRGAEPAGTVTGRNKAAHLGAFAPV